MTNFVAMIKDQASRSDIILRSNHQDCAALSQTHHIEILTRAYSLLKKKDLQSMFNHILQSQKDPPNSTISVAEGSVSLC